MVVIVINIQGNQVRQFSVQITVLFISDKKKKHMLYDCERK